MSDLISFWLNQCQSIRAYELLSEHGYDHDKIKFGDIGGLNVRLSGQFFEPYENGEFMIAQAVWEDVPTCHNHVEEPLLYDIIAWHPANPRKWYSFQGEPGLILGERTYFEASLFNDSLILHSTPLAWLCAKCTGCVLLDHHGLNRLYGLSEVVCEGTEHGTRIEDGLSKYYKTNMPRISVYAAEVRA